jgi:hypothetical protein
MTARSLQKPRLVYETSITRRKHGVRLRLQLIILLAAGGAIFALNRALAEVTTVDPLLLNIGLAAALLVFILIAIRALINLVRWFRRRDEQVRFFDQGFVWRIGGTEHRYGWKSLRTLREGGSGIYIGRRPLVQWGAHTLTMRDGQVFKLTPAHGNLRLIARAIRPHAGAVTGDRMAQMLRAEKPVRLHPQLTVWPGGVEAGKHEIHWSQLDVVMQRRRLIVRSLNENGRFETVKTYRAASVDNLGGFIELVASTLPNYQRERFSKAARPATT